MKFGSIALTFLTIASSARMVFGDEDTMICSTRTCVRRMDARRLVEMPESPAGDSSRRLLATTVLDFEGLGSLNNVGSFYASQGIYFSSNALSIKDWDAGGTGNFANEPSPDTILFFLSGDDVTVNIPGGFTTGFSFLYSSNTPTGSVDVYSELNKQGVKLQSIPLQRQFNNNCNGDPTGAYCNWTPVGVSFSGIAKSIDFGGSANFIAFDDVTFGSSTPGEVGGALNDPHIKTWAGTYYDYMGACDLVLVHAPNFEDDKALDIHIRTATRYDYSYTETAAVRIGDEILEVSSFGDYFLNGVSSATMPASIAGYPINYTRVDTKTVLFEILIGSAEKIVLRTFKDWVSVTIQDAEKKRFSGSHGLMGEFGTGTLLARDGKSVLEDPNEFGAEWQVRDDEPMLFQSIRAPQYPETCRLPDPAKAAGRRLGETSVTVEAAEAACAKWEEATRDACIHDVLATGDLDLADAGAF